MKEKYHIGDRFKVKDEIYILAQVGTNLFHLIGLDSGNRYSEPYRPRNKRSIIDGLSLSQIKNNMARKAVFHKKAEYRNQPL